MRKFWQTLRSVVVALMTCAMIALPSCASMGGGMKAMFSESPPEMRDSAG